MEPKLTAAGRDPPTLPPAFQAAADLAEVVGRVLLGNAGAISRLAEATAGVVLGLECGAAIAWLVWLRLHQDDLIITGIGEWMARGAAVGAPLGLVCAAVKARPFLAVPVGAVVGTTLGGFAGLILANSAVSLLATDADSLLELAGASVGAAAGAVYGAVHPTITRTFMALVGEAPRLRA